ncbi:hypothetical protein GCM10011581_30930 [Saccharopolyspora subtropica]|uniref:Uncharacterized protein n=2 Tax=Saccharopolyspora thermophila TaxID=89367 RepID=A0A917NE19_9PSEU|nr:hypothetical protein GCM10011581_30930 [Saccharopolyspora subtropica]
MRLCRLSMTKPSGRRSPGVFFGQTANAGAERAECARTSRGWSSYGQPHHRDTSPPHSTQPSLDAEPAWAFILDLTDEDRIEPTVGTAEAALKPIEMLVANAGYGIEGIFEESSMADLRHQFEINVFGGGEFDTFRPRADHDRDAHRRFLQRGYQNKWRR